MVYVQRLEFESENSWLEVEHVILRRGNDEFNKFQKNPVKKGSILHFFTLEETRNLHIDQYDGYPNEYP